MSWRYIDVFIHLRSQGSSLRKPFANRAVQHDDLLTYIAAGSGRQNLQGYYKIHVSKCIVANGKQLQEFTRYRI